MSYFLKEEIRDIVRALPHLGQISSTAYDTAWVARLGDVEQTRSEESLEWLRENQLMNGSWGAKEVIYHHDRLLCTLSAMIALAETGRTRDQRRWERAQSAIQVHLERLQLDLAGETIGFEVLFPTLLAEAEAMGILKSQNSVALQRIIHLRNKKLSSIPKGIINRFVSLSYSAEMAGQDGIDLLDLTNLQDVNGAIGQSPSATAYYATHIRKGDLRSLAYLHRYANSNGVPPVMPIDIFEQSWLLWNLSLTDLLDDELLKLWQPSLDWLQASWHPQQGVGHSTAFTPKEGDDTAVTYEVLTRFGRSVPIEALLQYEEEDCFRCFDFENNRSTSTNIHVLSALKEADYERDHPTIQKIVNFLRQTQHDTGFWIDKWHVSPYYPTTHLIISGVGYLQEKDISLQKPLDWILNTQNPDGSWGYYTSTAEETANCLQALSIAKRHGYNVPKPVLDQGKFWLMDHADPPYPPLWIAKCLYTPILVIRTTIVSALALVD